ncbi:OmpA family protein [Hanstruepera ponticola]|uniref:OmpA family protein n=1 Tax=Hanstruepera ponticola TaxID=2042995 RepID=UPI00177B6CF7|nr:OmpA family protein [Hanstruepera ponticola]
MKKIKILITLVILSGLTVTAQNKDTQTADKLFNRLEFVDAIEAYNKLVENGKANEYVYKQLGDANYKIFATEEAEKWYAKALETSQDSETIYNYSQMLKANGKYDESSKWMRKFADMNPKDDRAKAFKNNPDFIPGILEGEKKYELKTLGFNSEESDFGGTVNNEILYFASARNNARRNYGWNEEPYLDVYQVSLTLNDEDQEADLVEGNINTKHHEGTVAFSPDGNTMYFSRESYFEGDYEKDKDSKSKFSVLYLYKATKDGDKWSNVEPLHINNKNYNISAPTMSADGKTLYFHSNMPGGFGLEDIYKVSVNSDGTVGEPENLGDKINTEGSEKYAFISSENTLYFSSNGHLGLGGLDVFFVSESGTIENVGVPINSNSDDFAFTINEETKEGFVSSNRPGGKGGDDIYGVKRLEPCNVMLTTSVIDSETGEPLSGATVVIKDSNDRIVLSETSDDKGQVSYEVTCEKSLEISGTLPDYEGNTLSFAGSQDEEVNLQLELKPIDKIIVEDRVVLNPILFDFDKSNITSQGAFELDKLVAVMNKYPDMVILAESHTDSRGSVNYNEKLSDRRAKSTVQYVISKGIDANRISGIGKGENELKVDCGSKCTEEEHQMNRRSEFIIVSGGPNQN